MLEKTLKKILTYKPLAVALSTFFIASSAMTDAKPTCVRAGIVVPDTPLVRKALDFARANNDDFAYNHVVRSWLLGQANINGGAPGTAGIDAEVFAVSAILHDLGWSKTNESLVSSDKRFEVDSAIAARNFLEREAGGEAAGWDKHRIQLVWDAIALHTSGDIAAYKEAEVANTFIGIIMDFMGPETAKMVGGEGIAVTMEQFNEIVKEYPRDRFKDQFLETICGFCKTKPHTTYDNFMGQFGEKFVEGFTVEGKQTSDLILNVLIE